MTTTQETGDSAITSYNLEWDQGNGNSVFTELVGESTPYTLLTHTESSLTAGVTYTFRLRAENAHGFGDYSSTLSVLAAEEPAQVTILSTSEVSDDTTVLISWTAPSS